MPRYFPILPPELWELIIKEHHLYRLEYIKTIKTIPSRHCIISTVYCQLIQPYIDTNTTNTTNTTNKPITYGPLAIIYNYKSFSQK
jgi:hypothetical protein